MGWVVAAYGVVLITFASYAMSLVRRERTLRRELAGTAGSRAREGG
jgi:hypothetical protein